MNWLNRMPRINKPDNQKTQINVLRTTRDKLNKLRDYPREYLDSIINRLIKSYEELIQEAIK